MAFTRALAILILTFLLGALPAQAAEPNSAQPNPALAQTGQWGALMNWGLPATHQVLLRNGKVLFWRKNDEAKIWDPISGQLTPMPAPYPIPGTNIHCSGHVVLADGRVLVVGGQVDGPHTAINFATIFDPATNQWTKLPDMNYQRWYPTATELADGQVLIANGEGPVKSDRVQQLEVYDPLANKFSVLPGADRAEDFYSFNFLLPNGRVFNATPSSETGGLRTATLDLLARTWSPAPDAHWRTSPYSESAVMYRPGKILRAGGEALGNNPTHLATNQAEIIDMTAPAPAWEVTAPMAFPRNRLNVVIMADGQVMAVGGTRQDQDSDQSVYEAEIWNPDTKQWTTVAAMSNPRAYHSAALLLPDGRILSAGGEPGDFLTSAGSATALTAQLYSPPYLFKGPRPVITGAPGRIGYNAAFSVTTPSSASIASVALIRPSAVTHANNMEQKYIPLSFTKAAGGLAVTSPLNANWAPPGFYMLVIKNDAGVPSVAKWMQVGEGAVLGNPVPLDDAADNATPVPDTGDTTPTPGGDSAQSRGTRLTAAPRIRLRTLRRQGLSIGLEIHTPLTAAHPVLRVRVLKVLSAKRRVVVATVYRRAPRQGKVRVRIGARTLRRLRYGRYELVAAVGNSRHALRLPVRRRFSVVR